MTNRLKRFNHQAWLIIKFFWTVIFFGICVNFLTNFLSSDGVLKWMTQHIIIVMIAFGSFTAITVIVGIRYSKQGDGILDSGPRPTVINWIRQIGKPVIITALLLTMAASALTPVSSALAITGVVAATLLLTLIIIEFFALVRAPSPNTVKNPPPVQPLISRRILSSFLVGGAAGELLLAWPTTTRLYELLFPSKSPVIVTIMGGSGREEWIRAAAETFNQQQGAAEGIKVVLVGDGPHGSLDTMNQILSGKQTRPVAWIPGSSLEVQLLRTLWQQRHPELPNVVDLAGDFAPQSLAYSPLVFATWEDRAKVLASAGYWPLDWSRLRDLLTRNWSDIPGGNREWGHVKFEHTQPDESNSGLLTVALLTYDYFGKSSNLTPADIDDPQFQKYFKEFEKEGVWCYGPSSTPFIDSVIELGPNACDIITAYESLVLTREKTAKERWKQPLVMCYPPGLNIISDHPFVILQGDWVSDNQRQAAKQFLQFLLAKEQQKHALARGYRSNIISDTPTMPKEGASNLQSQIKSNADLSPRAQPLSGEVIIALTELWKKQQNKVGGGVHECQV